MTLKKEHENCQGDAPKACPQCGYKLEPNALRCPRCFKSLLSPGCSGCNKCSK